MLPAAPSRLSMTTCRPQLSPSFAPITRPTTSSAPPAAKGTTRRIGFVGYVWAPALTAAIANNAKSNARAGIVMQSPKAGDNTRMKKQVFYFHSLSSPWAYMGWPTFRALIEKHDLDVVVRPTRIVPPNGGI